MAIDTQTKRRSAIDPGMPWRRDWPVADGTLDAADRAHSAFLYSFGGAALSTADAFYVRASESQVVTGYVRAAETEV